MKIPKQIQIAGKTVTVKRNDNFVNSEGLIGQNRGDEDIIYLPTESSHFSKQCIEQTFIHEVIHKINHVLDRSDTVNDEIYVNPLSEFLYQFFKQVEETK